MMQQCQTIGGAPSQLLDLPDEIIHHILYYVAPSDTLTNVALTCRRLKQLANEPLLWRYYCSTEFTYWDAKHSIQQRFAGKISDVNWKKLYVYRCVVAQNTRHALNGILDGQTGRIEKSESLDRFGYDAKDTLLQECNVDDSVPDVLARRFYGNAVLDRLHRSKALEEWHRLSLGEPVSLERALSAFDLFILHDQHGDLSETSALLDGLATRLQLETPDIHEYTTRQKAIAIARFLRAHNLTGIEDDLMYRELQNNYISVALQDDEHPSLPLISVAIFCSLANRIGIDAQPCAFPSHVHAIVLPPARQTLDGEHLSPQEAEGEPMFLDPFNSCEEVPAERLKAQLTSWGVDPMDAMRFLKSSAVENLVLRTSRNILATVHDFRGHPNREEYLLRRQQKSLHSNAYADMDNAFYSALWANFLLKAPRADILYQRNFIPMIIERFEHLYPMDAALIQRYIFPAFLHSPGADHEELFETLRVVRLGDSMPKQIRTRESPETRESVKYFVGQVFQHRRYEYTAVITGWDVECGMNSQWIEMNRVDTLERGRHQSFYHALVEDTSIRYVAEDNIRIIEPEVPQSLMSLAGRYFKRWDHATHRFVSNIRDEYPDD